jgi:hypothetical protein
MREDTNINIFRWSVLTIIIDNNKKERQQYGKQC